MIKVIEVDGWFTYAGERVEVPLERANLHFFGYHIHADGELRVIDVWEGNHVTACVLPLGCAVFDLGVVVTKIGFE